MGIRRDIELFHLVFCRSFLTTQDKTLIALKGGCNLRFFLGSNRYSEDIDFDVETIARETLKKRVDKVLNSQPLRALLAAQKVELASHAAPKQTDTVQRWKVTLRSQGLDVPSKIEFSRRGIDRSGTSFDPIDPMLLGAYGLSPNFMTHYGARHAVQQKIEALAGRPETQARDVYDLSFLLSRRINGVVTVPAATVEQAIACAAGVDFDQFRGQVGEFLPEDAKEFYATSTAWEALQLDVIAKLEALL
jgi:predicted nucleotidyltransferase component of viral defense system